MRKVYFQEDSRNLISMIVYTVVRFARFENADTRLEKSLITSKRSKQSALAEIPPFLLESNHLISMSLATYF
jgi:hypothetical protein